jgi:hypothetical protein
MSETALRLEVWRLHPHGIRIIPADTRLLGETPPAALKWCGPFTFANRSGWWVYPPLDMDIIYRPVDEAGPYDDKYDVDPNCRALNMMSGRFDHRIVSDYEHEEISVLSDMLRPHHQYRHATRQLYAFGDVEMNVVTIWTGCVFRTPPGWCLQIRSPINIALDTAFRVQEAILETDWMQYDIWMNLKFTRYNEWVSLRREQTYPVAQLVPVKRESYDPKWGLEENVFNNPAAPSEAAEQVFERWHDYNYHKWLRLGEKDSTTHNRQRLKQKPPSPTERG